MLKRPELLIPAGGPEQLEVALLYGADAVYLSGNELSLRAKCDGFSLEELKEGVKKAHGAGAKVYYCLNAMPYDRQLDDVVQMLKILPDYGVDALIIADPGVLHLAKKHCPGMEIHLSTQAHSVNSAAVEFWKEIGVHRINLARELGKAEMTKIISTFPDTEFEIFVHGAMCLALSGHCLMSAWVNKRPANLGQCTQPCRFEYRGRKFTDISLTVEEKLRQGEDCWDIEQGTHFSAIFAPSDLCLVPYMDELVAMQPASLKIEGRTKSPSYVAQVTDVYRTALDLACIKQGIAPKFAPKRQDIEQEEFMLELFNSSGKNPRPLTTGFFFPERQDRKAPENYTPRPMAAKLGKKIRENLWEVDVRNTWNSEKDAWLVLPGMDRPCIRQGTYTLYNHQQNEVRTLHPGLKGFIRFEQEPQNLAENIFIRA